MTNNRILVRVINHALNIDAHELKMATSDVFDEATAIANVLISQTNCPRSIMIDALSKPFVTQGAAEHSTHYCDGWLVQMRLDDKQIVGQASAANDNQPEMQQAIS